MHMSIEVHKIKVEMGDVMINYCYILVDNETSEAAIVDPAWQLEKIVAVIEKEKVKIKYVLITHVHFDHIDLAVTFAEKYKVPIYIHELDLKRFPFSPSVELFSICELTPLWTGDANVYPIQLGNAEVIALHTPGHTEGSMCFYAGSAIITGDTLFIEGCGVCDDITGDPEAMFRSLEFITRFISGDTMIYPGHCYGIEPGAYYKDIVKKNIYLHIQDIDKFVKIRMRKHQTNIFNFK